MYGSDVRGCKSHLCLVAATVSLGDIVGDSDVSRFGRQENVVAG